MPTQREVIERMTEALGDFPGLNGALWQCTRGLRDARAGLWPHPGHGNDFPTPTPYHIACAVVAVMAGPGPKAFANARDYDSTEVVRIEGEELGCDALPFLRPGLSFVEAMSKTIEYLASKPCPVLFSDLTVTIILAPQPGGAISVRCADGRVFESTFASPGIDTGKQGAGARRLAILPLPVLRKLAAITRDEAIPQKRPMTHVRAAA